MLEWTNRLASVEEPDAALDTCCQGWLPSQRLSHWTRPILLAIRGFSGSRNHTPAHHCRTGTASLRRKVVVELLRLIYSAEWTRVVLVTRCPEWWKLSRFLPTWSGRSSR